MAESINPDTGQCYFQKGTRYGRLVVDGEIIKDRNYVRVPCKCDCGSIKIVRGDSLRSATRSCGCIQKEKAAELGRSTYRSNVGERYGRLVVLRRTEKKKHPRYICMCDCGKEVEVSKEQLRSGNTRSCGCFRKDEARRKRYKPNLSDLARLRRRNELTLVYRKWRKDVFDRDGFICQKCKQSSKKLIAHHKYSYRAYKNKRVEVNNGVTVCISCHFEFHREYGFGYNTEEQWQDFVRIKEV